ncbi:molybdopterin-dependent oxidoreductase [Halomonas sp. GT]|uniref:molybdopterin-dependent oxidoreductase n=1 Tax=Halomonas sp. GT TaxID=1971364 RepID=UPI0009F41D47|nr:molybdopterin-dependent oxidoreductase [Halomonas sp. GT]
MLMLSIPVAGLERKEASLEVLEGPVILTISGDITHFNAAQEMHFDRGMLQALPQHSFETGTPWTEGSSTYSGPLMRTLLEYVGLPGSEDHSGNSPRNSDEKSSANSVYVSALNGYEAEIPISDFYEYDVILALERNGQSIPIREYGPLWVLYPFSQDETLLSEKMRFRAVWQVMQINVR